MQARCLLFEFQRRRDRSEDPSAGRNDFLGRLVERARTPTAGCCQRISERVSAKHLKSIEPTGGRSPRESGDHSMSPSNTNWSRRKFLGRGAAVGAGTIAASSLGVRNAHGANERLRVGVMGLSRGIAHVRAALQIPYSDVAYVCDVDQQRVERGLREVDKAGGPKAEGVTDFRRILDDSSVRRAHGRDVQPLARAGDDSRVCRREARLRREARKSQRPGSRVDGRRREKASTRRPDGQSAPIVARCRRGHREGEGRPGGHASVRALLVQQHSSVDRQGHSCRRPGPSRLLALAGTRAGAPVQVQPHPLQLALALALGRRGAREQRCPRARRGPVGARRRPAQASLVHRWALLVRRRSGDARRRHRDVRLRSLRRDVGAVELSPSTARESAVRYVLWRRGARCRSKATVGSPSISRARRSARAADRVESAATSRTSSAGSENRRS